MPESNPKLQLALAHAALGRRIFPVVDKRPVVKWSHSATSDPQELEDWWGAWPDADPAWALPADVLVLDVDLKNGGPDTLFALELEHGELPETAQQQTRGGGSHYVYRTGAPVPNSAGRVGRGLDIRSTGGYIVLYAGLGEVLADAPGWLVDLAGTKLAASAEAPAVELDLVGNVDRANAFLDGTAPAVEGEGGNAWTYKTACVVRDFGLSEDACLSLMSGDWNNRCSPPWPLDELRGVVHNAYEYATRPAGAERAATLERFGAVEVPAQKTSDATTQKPSGRFRPLGWDDIQKMEPPTWMVRDTLAEQSLGMIYGPWGTYKSFIALDIALSVATGRPWAGRDVVGGAPQARRVAYVAGEGTHGIRLRASAWATAAGVSAVPGFALVPVMPLFGRDDDLRDFGADLRAWKPELIVIDTVAHAMAGLDENAQKDAGLFIARCIELRNAFQCAVLLVHHTGKDENKGARGSTVIPAGLDTLFRTAMPRPFEATLTMEKQKDAAAWEQPQGFRAEKIGASLVLRPAEVSKSAGDEQDKHRESVLRSVLASGQSFHSGALADEMARELNPGSDAVSHESLRVSLTRWLQRFSTSPAADGVLLHRGKGRNDPHLWQLKAEAE